MRVQSYTKNEGKRPKTTLKRQTTLASFARGKTKEAGKDEYKALANQQSGTRNFPTFELGEGTVLNRFHQWLMGVEGKRRSPKEAKEISIDVSKALR